MRKYTLCPLVALALGCGGAALRMWQESRYTDGFPPTGDLSSLLLIALCVLAAAGAALLARRSRELRPGALFSGPSRMIGALLILSSLAFLGSAIFHLVHIIRITGIGPDVQVSPLVILTAAPLELLQTILSVPTVVCLVFLAKDALVGEGRSLDSLTVLLPAVCGWLWLIDLYRRSVSDPIVWDYVFLMLAIVVLLLAVMARAGFSFADGNPRQTVFFGLFGLFLTSIAFLQAQDMPARLSLAAFSLYVLAALLGLLSDQPMPEPQSDIILETEESSDE